MTAASVAPSLDFEAIATSLILLAGAVAAIVAGAWRGWQAVKKSLLDPTSVSSQTDEKIKIVSATIVETTTLARLTESNNELRGSVCDLLRGVNELTYELRENRHAAHKTGDALDRLQSSLDRNSRVIEQTGLKL